MGNDPKPYRLQKISYKRYCFGSFPTSRTLWDHSFLSYAPDISVKNVLTDPVTLTFDLWTLYLHAHPRGCAAGQTSERIRKCSYSLRSRPITRGWPGYMSPRLRSTMHAISRISSKMAMMTISAMNQPDDAWATYSSPFHSPGGQKHNRNNNNNVYNT